MTRLRKLGGGSNEHEQQKALVRWAAMRVALYPELELLFSVPNGGKRDARTGAMLKAEGLKRGVPDLCLPVARQGWHGLFIELKWDAGKPKPEQVWWSDRLTEQGYLAVVCYGWAEAVNVLCDYLGAEDEKLAA